MFKQREILVTLDGQDQATFSEHVNFVSVQLEKRHQSGEVTTDEVVISPQLFEAEGNAFFLRYGWKGDDDRERWLGYDVKTVWSFHGGIEIRSDWEPRGHADAGAGAAASVPHGDDRRGGRSADRGRGAARRRQGHAAGWRARSRSRRRRSATADRCRAAVLEVAEDPDGPASTVEITWYLEGARDGQRAAPPLAGDLVYWDELPEGGP